MGRAAVVVALVLVALSAGCGGGGGDGQVTMPSEGAFPAVTERVPTGDPRAVACRRDAAAFARHARLFAVHFESAAYPADQAYELLRGDLADFQARACDLRLLGGAVGRLPKKQPSVLVENVPSDMARVLRKALSLV